MASLGNDINTTCREGLVTQSNAGKGSVVAVGLDKVSLCLIDAIYEAMAALIPLLESTMQEVAGPTGLRGQAESDICRLQACQKQSEKASELPWRWDPRLHIRLQP